MSKRHGALITPVKQYGARWGYDEYFSSGTRVQVRRLTKDAAVKAHDDLLILVQRGRRDLLNIDPTELARFRAWEQRNHSSMTVQAAVDEFLAEKRLDGDARRKWLRMLSDYLRMLTDEFGEWRLSDLPTAELEKWMRSRRLTQRTWNNLRGPMVQLAKWAKAKRYLPDETSDLERVKRFKIKRSEKITHWEPEEMQLILDTASADDRVWYLLTAFGGLRTEELMPEYKDKDPLRWEDFDWNERVIHLRQETSKIGEARNTPISDQLWAWLQPYRGRRGPCLPIGRRPRVITRHTQAACGLDNRPNANRHSFGIYRRMESGSLAVTAEEMGTSEGRVKVNYSRPKNPSALKAWKAIMPKEDGKIVAMPEQGSAPKRQRTRKVMAR